MRIRLLTFITVAGLSGCDVGLFDCGEGAYVTQASPDGRRSITLKWVNCGATTPETSWLMLRATNGPSESRIAVFEGRAEFVRWKGSDHIEVDLGPAELVKGEERWGTVRITYKAGETEAEPTS